MKLTTAARAQISSALSLGPIAAIAGAAGWWLAGPAVAHAQQRDSVPCCTVVRIDTVRALVTARETATGYTFRVDVKTKKALAAIKVGDKVWASFATKRARFAAAGDTLCCAILETPSPGGRLAPFTP